MKTTVVHYRCDLCDDTTPAMPDGGVKGNWLTLTFGDAKSIRDTYEKHICDGCLAQITDSLGLPTKR